MRAGILSLALLAVLAAAAPAPAGELPLGPRWVPETRTASVVAPGITYIRIERGFASARDAFTVDVGFTATRSEARGLRRRLRDAGYAARIERVRQRAPMIPSAGRLATWCAREHSPTSRPQSPCAKSS
jgi:hypothetical protein